MSLYSSYHRNIRRIAVLGGESTGKSTLCEALAEALDTVYVEEYGRARWEQKQGQFDYLDMLHIAQTQLRQEQELLPLARDWMVCDTTPLATLFYSLQLFGRADPQLRVLADTHYDYYLLCADDFEFVQDGTRQDATFRAMQNRWFEHNLARRGIRWRRLEGSLQARLEQALEYLC